MVFLGEVSERLTRGEVVQLSVRELIAHWNAQRRGYRVVKAVNRDLASAGLTTIPPFDETGLDSTISIERQPEASPAPEPKSKEYGLSVGTVPSATGGVVSVASDDSLMLAYTKMQIHDFSQLPVMSGRAVKGAVTWRSMAAAMMRSPIATVQEAMTKAVVVRFDEDLLALASIIAECEFVLVKDQRERVTGLVTAEDLTRLFADRARTFLQLGEVDQRLRDLLASRVALADVQELCSQPDGTSRVMDFDDMSIGDYQRVLENPRCWDCLGWPLERREFLRLLDDVRGVRNDVMHFNPDPIEPDRLARVQGLVTLLRNHT